MWNLGILAQPGARFRAAAPNHPEALLEEPQAFQAVGENSFIFVFLHEVIHAHFFMPTCETFLESECFSTAVWISFMHLHVRDCAVQFVSAFVPPASCQ